ncbi:MAG: hypothetical protein KDA84_14920, partial [Planctomycetaceae bacterium]|nr:hypothetical protein [Planctomycetaceae bacterium]
MRSFETIFFDIGDTLVSQGNWVRGATDILDALKSSGVRLGLISNTGNLSRDQLQNHLPGDFRFDSFDDGLVLLSSEVGIEKPHLGIFLLAIQRAGISPWR